MRWHFEMIQEGHSGRTNDLENDLRAATNENRVNKRLQLRALSDRQPSH